MLMRGDLNKIIENVNKVTEKLAARIESLEKEMAALKAPKPRGRPPGSKNK